MADATCNNRVLEGTIRGTNFTVSGIDDAGRGLVQQFQLEFQRKLTRIYDLASPAFYYIEGPPEGSISFTKVVGPLGAPKISCDCQPRTLLLNAGNTLCYGRGTPADPADFSYTLLNAMPYGLVASGTSENMVIMAGLSYMFADLQ
jgi:hypothetical protein